MPMEYGSKPVSPGLGEASAAGTTNLLRAIWRATGGDDEWVSRVEFTEAGDLPSVFAVSDLAAASTGAVALAIAEHMAATASRPAAIEIDRRLASFWFATSIEPQGWAPPPAWDPIAGDYPTADGWIRLHTNAPHHRAAALAVLGTPAEQKLVRSTVMRWKADELEAAVIARGGCAATMRSSAAWADHPQGKAVIAEPLVRSETTDAATSERRALEKGRPLAGVRVLDLTRVLAGPVATRFLAGFGAEVLRIDPPDWDEPSLAPDVTLGKRCARLDLRSPSDRGTLLELLSSADVIVHGYRPDALERLGLGAEMRARVRPGIIDVSLDAYGWTGPWAARRGFDSLVQMSTGIAFEGMERLGKDRPTPLPVQALDHATGYIMAAAVVRGLTERRSSGVGSITRVSLARTAALLSNAPRLGDTQPLRKLDARDFDTRIEETPWGPARRLRPPVAIEGSAMKWEGPATSLGSSPPRWQA
jgi:crotonobetainyl-CoA:carnitine CoA-transferase CaiB-like acyl-CoA transferase